jgi:uncharacterized repeat protein (TIGR03833 family)
MNLTTPHTPNMYRANIALGMEVQVVLKKDQRTGKRTVGQVRAILTSKPFHSRGIKVMLDSRQVGRVQEIGVNSTSNKTDS